MEVKKNRGNYNSMNKVLELINKDYISLREENIRRNNAILTEFLEEIIRRLKSQDILFQTLFDKVFYGGSYYDGLRITHPNEFDLDLLLNLGKLPGLKTELIHSDTSGYVHLRKITCFTMSDLERRCLDKLFIGEYLDNRKVRSWIEGIVTKAINMTQGWFHLSVGSLNVKMYKSGPAFTLNLYNSDTNFDIDLVPCFEFDLDKCPRLNYDTHNAFRKYIFIVPKPFKLGVDVSTRYWRVSFQQQERELLNGKYFLKPSVKLLKKMRDVLQHNAIASYYIKTVALWENKNNSLNWNAPLSEGFMKLLKEYYRHLCNNKIPFFWDTNNNLLEYVGDDTIDNFKNKIRRVIYDIDNNLDNPYTVTKYLLTREEFSKFQNDYVQVESIQSLVHSEVEEQSSSCIIL